MGQKKVKLLHGKHLSYPCNFLNIFFMSLGTFDFAGNPETEFVKLVCVPQPEISLNTRASALSFKLENGADVLIAKAEDLLLYI